MSSVPLHKKPNTKVLPTDVGYDVTLHGHTIVSIRGNLILLNTCGWTTKTTRRRMNEVLELEGVTVRVHPIKGHWYCGDNPFMSQMNTNYYGVRNDGNLYCTINKDNTQ